MRQPVPVQTSRSDVPDGLAAVVTKMMAKQPWDRFQTPAEVADALASWTTRNVPAETPTEKSERTVINRRPPRKPRSIIAKKRWLAPAAVAGVLLLVGIVIAVAASGGKNDPEKPVIKDSATDIPKQAAKVLPPSKEQSKEAKTGEIRQYPTKGDQIERVALSPDEQIIAGGSRTGWVKFWDLETGQLLKEIKGHNGVVWFVAYSPSGRLLASSGQDGTIKIWNTQSWKEEKKITPPKGSVWSSVFSPDGKLLFSGGEDGLGRFWNVETGELVRSCAKPHEKSINWVAWSPDGKFVCTAGWDNMMRCWDAATGALKFEFKSDKKFQMVAVSPDSSAILCAPDASIMYLVDARTGLKKYVFSHDKMKPQWCAAFSKDGTLAVSGGNEPLVRVWDVPTGTPYQEFSGHSDGVSGCAITADGLRIVTASKDKTVRLWNVPKR